MLSWKLTNFHDPGKTTSCLNSSVAHWLLIASFSSTRLEGHK